MQNSTSRCDSKWSWPKFRHYLSISLPTRSTAKLKPFSAASASYSILIAPHFSKSLKEEPGMMMLTHIYQPPESRPPPEQMDAKIFFPWSEQKVLGGETVIISKMTDLPPEAGHRLGELPTSYGTKSTVASSIIG